LFRVEKLSAAKVWRKTSPGRIIGQTAIIGCATLRRWIHAIRTGTLLDGKNHAGCKPSVP
jgi:hypothetical protein